MKNKNENKKIKRRRMKNNGTHSIVILLTVYFRVRKQEHCDWPNNINMKTCLNAVKEYDAINTKHFHCLCEI